MAAPTGERRGRAAVDPGAGLILSRRVARGQRLVWLAGYVRSGTTWREALLANFLAARDEPVGINETDEALPGKRSCDPALFERLTGLVASDLTQDEADAFRPAVYRALAGLPPGSSGVRLYCPAHEACLDTPAGEPLFPDDATCGALYAVRNPLDVAVSWAFYLGVDFERAVNDLCDPSHQIGHAEWPRLREILGDWSSHVQSWQAAPFPVLTVRYEDMLTDPASELGRMTRFLRLEGAADPRQLRRAVGFAGFANLQDSEEREGYRNYLRQGRRFFRSGKAGDWRHHLTAAQARRLVDAHGQVMTALGYDLRDYVP